MRLAFLVPAPGHDEPWQWAFDAEADALVSAGAEVDPIAWTEAHDFSAYDLILPLVVWGYHLRYTEWLGFLARLEAERLPVANPPQLLRWNSDKAYLAELEEKGVSTVPSIVAPALDQRSLAAASERFGTRMLVIKPPVSASAADTYRISPHEQIPALVLGKRMIAQPYVEAIADEGEYSLMLFDGVPSHCVVKRPKRGDFRVQPHLGGVARLCEAPEGAEQLAKTALAAAPAAAIYARVDMIRGAGGELQIMELELVEPALFLHLAPDQGAAFTQSVRRAAERARKEPLAQR